MPVFAIVEPAFERAGKGSHRVWYHPSHPGVEVTLSGAEGNDARFYQVRQVREAINEVAALIEQEESS